MKILVTGTAGFIGSHTARRLIDRGDTVVGLDSVNDYYDVTLKYGRLAESGIAHDAVRPGETVQSAKFPNYRFIQLKLEERDALTALFEREKFDVVCHLAAQAGVRYSLENPHAYIEANLVGFMNILENCRRYPVRHLVYASSSSVYGLNTAMPFSTSHAVDHPVSLYAATKKANELMAHTYSHLYGLPTTGLRFFTVYGPWGRPDMALFLYTDAILAGRPIEVFNHGNMQRDFTYIDDIVEGVVRVIDRPPAGDPSWDGARPDPASSHAPYRLYNIGNSAPVKLTDFIEAIEQALGKKATRELLPLQPGDVPATYADVSDLTRDTGYRPATDIAEGVRRFVAWYRAYYGR
ncbi:MAG TPA: NAD-dependent epimerase [bacterium]|nr:NAD-dependent epimerase [bacterium]